MCVSLSDPYLIYFGQVTESFQEFFINDHDVVVEESKQDCPLLANSDEPQQSLFYLL